ncbi:GNAT family N-acetyltransferase [Nostoc sp. RF31YmG]|nr:GNAT family N-acetyltransferase [Nostoc sp. RF31YmG]
MVSDSEARWNFFPIDKQYRRDTFDCGYAILNDYLKKYARENHNKGIAKTFVAIPASGSLKIDGYYTVSASIIEYKSLLESYQRGMPTYPIPAMLIGRLAVDKSMKAQGLGSELLADALYRAVRAAQEIGIFAVRVDAIDLQAKAFYLKYEFIPFQDNELSLFLPMATIMREFQ